MKHIKSWTAGSRTLARKVPIKLDEIRKAFDKGNNIYCLRNNKWWQGPGEKYAIYSTSPNYKEFKCPENWKGLSDAVKNMHCGRVYSFYSGGV
jgi:hypothetical protein